MTLPELRERVSGLSAGGYITVDSRFDPGTMDSMINSARAFIACERWKMYGKLPPSYYQNYSPVYNKDAQTDGCYSIFYDVPKVIALDGRAIGIGFIGTSETGEQINFRVVSNRAAFSSMRTGVVMRSGKKAYVLIGNDTWEIYYKDKIKQFTSEIIASDPREVPTYNIDFDDYPMDVSDIPKMETYLMQGYMGSAIRTPIDRIADGRDTTVNPPVRP